MKKMYKQVDYNVEVGDLKNYTVVAWSGKNLKYITVTLERSNGECFNRKYFFSSSKEYVRVNNLLRKLYYRKNC